jgi:bifunctional DNA-binding transcriptional regulator/antitoxin component of YhaV-PrlF toxin-antitoxin module
MSRRFTTTIEEDEHGELYFTIPDEILKDLGWDVGTQVEYIEDGDELILRRVFEQSR